MIVLVKFRIWLNRLFGFQTLKLRDRFSQDDTLARYYSLFLCVLIVILEGVHLRCSSSIYGGNKTVVGFTFLSLSVMTSASSVLCVLSDSCVYASEKVNLYNNFQKLHNTFLKENFSQSTVIESTNNVFIALMAYKCVHVLLALWSWKWDMFIIFIIFIISRTLILSLMTLQIVTEIYTCETHLRCIRNTILSSHSQQLRGKSGIDCSEVSFNLTCSNGRQERMLPEEQHNISIKAQMNAHTLINENLKLIANRFKYACLLTIFTSTIGLVFLGNISITLTLNQTLSEIGWLIEFLWCLGGIAVGAESLNSEHKRLIRTISKITIVKQKDQNLQIDLKRFSDLLLERKPSFVIAGVLTLDLSFLYSVAAVVTSYMIIFYQLDYDYPKA